MPIRAEFRHLYGQEWRTVIRPRVLARAHHACELCRKPLHAWIFTYPWKTRDPQFGGAWRYHMIWIQEGASADPLHNPLVEIVAAQVVVSGNRDDLGDSLPDLEDRHIERPTSQVENRDGWRSISKRT